MSFTTSWRLKHRQEFYAALLPSRPICFDVGANHGEHVATFLSLGAAKVIAVEPQGELCSFIENRFSDEVKEQRVIIRVAAVGAAEGTATLYIGPDAGRTMSSLSREFVETSQNNGQIWDRGAIEVPVTTLDFLIKEFGVPDYIKIDAEGFDSEVLGGLSSAVNLLSFEFNTQDSLISTAEDCVAIIERLGVYEFNYHAEVHGETALQFSQWVPASVMRYTLRHDIARQRCYGDIYARRRL